MDKPPVLYSQKSDNRDTFLIRRPASRDKEDKIHVHGGVAGTLLVDSPQKSASKPTVRQLRGYSERTRIPAEKKPEPVAAAPAHPKIRTRALQDFEINQTNNAKDNHGSYQAKV